ncbi:MAG: LytTR family DNA-binding domain-containing protein [Bacillota bacterium]|nr:LytTR family DNA-binding domain-containing protein [Bacillota bacterium]
MEKVSENEARKVYEKYIEEGLSMFPPFKGYGCKIVQFSMDEPEMYKTLFFGKKDISYEQYLEDQMEWKKILPSVQSSFGLSEREAKVLFRDMTIYLHGLASLFVNGACVMSEAEVSAHFGNVCRGLLMAIKSPKDERIKIIPSQTETQLGNIDDYIKGKKNVIVGYGPSKEKYQIHLDAILYFEAVGENVLAYTKANVYEIKHRLYKIEDVVKNMEFIRISKSLLVNIKKIIAISSAEGGRKSILLDNGENILASRMYVKELMLQMKESEE